MAGTVVTGRYSVVDNGRCADKAHFCIIIILLLLVSIGGGGGGGGTLLSL